MAGAVAHVDEAIIITRFGRSVVRLGAVSPEPEPVDIEAQREVMAQMQSQPESAEVFVRAMRDDEGGRSEGHPGSGTADPSRKY